MSSKLYSSEAFILSRKNYSEADRIIRIYSKDYGKLSVLAKGVRRIKSRKRGNIEVFSRVKFSANRSKSIDLLTETLPVELYSNLRINLKKTALAYYFMEIIDKITHDGEKQLKLYDCLVVFMNRLVNERKLKRLRIEFIYQVLVVLGYWPENKTLDNPDSVLADVLERKVNSFRVGKIILA